MSGEKKRFKFTVSLRQHSPLIHFQDHQYGAGLRATELKPKLDRYIIKKQYNDKLPMYEKFLVGYNDKQGAEHPALDYKIKITSPEARRFHPHSLFFGNMGIDRKTKKEKMSIYIHDEKDVVLEFFSFKPAILDMIESMLPGFLANTNFGTRQNKGFGSFYISERDKAFYKDIGAILPKGTPFLSIDSVNDNDILSTIEYYYKRLKSGINPSFGKNCKPGYYPSYLNKYLGEKNLGYTWEKRWLKETFFGLPPLDDQKEQKFARAMLGLPANYFFKRTDEPCNPHPEKTIIQNNTKISVSSDDIARIKSPITFKIIKNINRRETRIFILLDDDLIKKINDEVCQKKKSFKFKPGNHRLTLPAKMIDIDDLLECYHRELNNIVEFTYLEKKNDKRIEHPITLKARISRL